MFASFFNITNKTSPSDIELLELISFETLKLLAPVVEIASVSPINVRVAFEVELCGNADL